LAKLLLQVVQTSDRVHEAHPLEHCVQPLLLAVKPEIHSVHPAAEVHFPVLQLLEHAEQASNFK
jgi:hypothetical protein